MKRRLLRSVMLVAMVCGMPGCAAVSDSSVFESDFWAASPMQAENLEAELGLGELSKGNFVLAESHFDKALKRNPKDVHALLGRAILYHHTGQTTRARTMYEAVLAIRPPESDQLMVMNNFTTRPVSEIASVNMALLDSGGVVGAIDHGAIQRGPGPAVGPMAEPMTPMGMMPNQAAAAPEENEASVFSRFATLRTLRDQGLITPDEYAKRRKANIGALLPLTSPPPAAGLRRPVPTADQIVGRLRAIGRALEMRAITVGQHAAERTMILDALLPDVPAVQDTPVAPPQGLMEAAGAVQRLEALRAENLISDPEYGQERAAIERGLAPAQMVPAPSQSMAEAGEPTRLGKGGGPQPAVHIASYKSRRAAEGGWAQLRRAHKGDLGGLSHEIAEVDLGPGKGLYFRLKAGPLASQGEAQALCRKLKARRQFCEPSFMNEG